MFCVFSLKLVLSFAYLFIAVFPLHETFQSCLSLPGNFALDVYRKLILNYLKFLYKKTIILLVEARDVIKNEVGKFKCGQLFYKHCLSAAKRFIV